jgi:hypothetical protein
MVAPGVFKHQETELEYESRVYDEKEARVNAEVFAAAQAHQAAERARLAHLRNEVASPSGSRSNVADSSGRAGDVAGPSKKGDNIAGVVDPSPAEFLKAWKKIGSAKENQEWNEMEREVRSSISRSIHFF